MRLTSGFIQASLIFVSRARNFAHLTTSILIKALLIMILLITLIDAPSLISDFTYD